jgi:hypothetical protein
MISASQNVSDLLHRTADALAAQGSVPVSPGRIEQDGRSLCAGAALVYQAAESTLARSDLDLLAREMIAGGKESIVAAGMRFNLDPHLVGEAIRKNDSCNDEERSENMIRFLKDLASRTGEPALLD